MSIVSTKKLLTERHIPYTELIGLYREELFTIFMKNIPLMQVFLEKRGSRIVENTGYKEQVIPHHDYRTFKDGDL